MICAVGGVVYLAFAHLHGRAALGADLQDAPTILNYVTKFRKLVFECFKVKAQNLYF